MDQVEVSTLSIGTELGDGGQGKVFALDGMSGVVFKRYHDSVTAASIPNALAELETRSSGLTADGRRVAEWAAWPHTQVTENGRFIGFLMPRVPEPFMLQVGGRKRLADLSYLATTPKPMWGPVTLPGMESRLQILAAYGSVVQALHDRELVIGDMSFGNVLWSASPTPSVMLLDCDGIQPESGPACLAQYDTLDWNDPLGVPGQKPDRDRDRYKLALAILRVLTRSLSIRPTDLRDAVLEVPEHVDGRIRDLAQRAGGPAGTRPTAGEWRSALLGRRTISVAKPTPRQVAPAPPPHDGVLVRRGPRKTLPVTPPAAP